ncbi:MAG: rod shape-determining protein MreD [Nocardioides sp.]|nr:rod shape-determining protein MreD [Nocardioides sp.]
MSSPIGPGLSSYRALVAVLLTGLALTVQVSVLPFVSWHGVVPNLVLLVVLATALSYGSEFAMVLGLAAGVMLDLAPPADHVAGRWAIALVAVGYLAGYVRSSRQGPLAVAGIVLASSFVGTSIFALSGVLLRDPVLGVGELLGGVLQSVVGDLLLAPLVLWPAMRVLRHVQLERATT